MFVPVFVLVPPFFSFIFLEAFFLVLKSFNGGSIKFKEGLKDVSKTFKGSFKGVFRKFQGCLKKV